MTSMMNIESKNDILQQQIADDLISQSTTHQRALIRVLGVCDRFGLAPEDAVRCFADEHRVTYHQNMANQLAEHLDQGGDIPSGLGANPDLVLPECVLALRLANRRDRRAEFFDSFLAHSDGEAEVQKADRNFAARYFRLWLKLFFVLSILAFMFLKVIPEFKDLTEEFGMENSAAFELFVYVGDFILKIGGILLLFSLLFVVLPMNFRPFRNSLQNWSPDGWQQSFVPRSVSRRRCLALIVQSRVPMMEGLEFIAKNGRLKRSFRKLDEIRDQLKSARNVWDCLATNGVITRMEARALSVTNSTETQAWLLRQRSEGTDEESSKRAGYTMQFVVGIVNTLIAVITLLAAVAVFTTMIGIMRGLS